MSISNKASNMGAASSVPNGSLVLFVVMWFITSIGFNYTAPLLSRSLQMSSDVSMIELTTTAAFAGAALLLMGKPLLPSRNAHMWVLTAALQLAGSRCFSHSLRTIPLSLAQTIRGTNPVWTVVVGCTLLSERYSLRVLMTLLPVIIGFGLATGADASVDMTGVLAATGSVICVVLVNMLVKRASAGAERPHTLQLQFWVVMFAALIQLPLFCAGGGLERVTDDLTGPRAGMLITLIVADGFMYFTEQTFHYLVLQGLSSLSNAVLDTVRRLVIVVVSGFILQGNSYSVMNISGALLVLLGALLYTRAQASVSAKKVD